MTSNEHKVQIGDIRKCFASGHLYIIASMNKEEPRNYDIIWLDTLKVSGTVHAHILYDELIAESQNV
jgi:hypothetical protein